MTQQDARTDHESAQPTRRHALRLGAGSALALLAAGLGGRTVLAIQDATPAASTEGGYAVIRIRELREDQDGEALLDLIFESFVPLVRQIPGFVSYTALADPASRNQVFIGVFEDQAGADESTQVAGDWLRDNQLDPYVGDPIVAEGAIAYTVEAGSDA